MHSLIANPSRGFALPSLKIKFKMEVIIKYSIFNIQFSFTYRVPITNRTVKYDVFD